MSTSTSARSLLLLLAVVTGLAIGFLLTKSAGMPAATAATKVPAIVPSSAALTFNIGDFTGCGFSLQAPVSLSNTTDTRLVIVTSTGTRELLLVTELFESEPFLDVQPGQTQAVILPTSILFSEFDNNPGLGVCSGQGTGFASGVVTVQ